MVNKGEHMAKRNHITIDSIYTQYKAGKNRNVFFHLKGLPEKVKTGWDEFKNYDTEPEEPTEPTTTP